MIDASMFVQVQAIVETVAAEEILPRFRRLAASEIAEKRGPHDLVTTADLAAEKLLSKQLARILPGSTVLGEEAVSADPDILAALDGDAPVWIVDPLDGTGNFVRGEKHFATMVALACQQRTLAAWIHAPALGLTATARAGAGARLNGQPVRLGPPRPLHDLEIVVTHPAYRTSVDRCLDRLVDFGLATLPCPGVGPSYIELACGRMDAAVFGWESPWDHAAGLLLHAEAGGASATLSGAPFRLGGNNALPLVIARDRDTVDGLRQILMRPG